MTERERIAALEEQIDVLADRLRGIGITAGRDVERALAALGKRQYITKLERQANVLRHTIAELDERSE